ncbi:hypothetical protein MLD38_025398 [Melastoma candidum]|uniref:Uncharacterized protein n=1 Tax=Melastoma candidum TaxID=119954 RepID=A0ACB9NWM4_9MYRT|nr:hypothetical protein MLD38_025398 [Melastoma candidum]
MQRIRELEKPYREEKSWGEGKNLQSLYGIRARGLDIFRMLSPFKWYQSELKFGVTKWKFGDVNRIFKHWCILGFERC